MIRKLVDTYSFGGCRHDNSATIASILASRGHPIVDKHVNHSRHRAGADVLHLSQRAHWQRSARMKARQSAQSLGRDSVWSAYAAQLSQ